ncbi:MAG: DinB family protein [Acidobacteriota bacterium]|nr:DinB family protein [Acidobacteriota bacterium]
MSDLQIGRPDNSELAPHAIAYFKLVEEDDVLTALRKQIAQTIALLKPLEDERASNFRFAPGKWTVKEVVGHLSDVERILSSRALRIARGDETPLPGFEQDDYVRTAGSNDRKLDDLLDELQVVRDSSLALFRSLPHPAWLRRGRVSEWNLTVRGIAFTLAGHELHHFKILRERYLTP